MFGIIPIDLFSLSLSILFALSLILVALIVFKIVWLRTTLFIVNKPQGELYKELGEELADEDKGKEDKGGEKVEVVDEIYQRRDDRFDSLSVGEGLFRMRGK